MCATITVVQKKHLSIEYNIAQPDGSTSMDVINASFALSIKKGPREEIVEERVAMIMIMMMMIIIIISSSQ
jgi:hypothetical protein